MKISQMTHWTAGTKFQLIFVGQWRHLKLIVNTGADCTYRAAATYTLHSEPFSKWHPFRFNIDFNSFPLLWFAKISRTEKNGWKWKTLADGPTTYAIFISFAVKFILTFFAVFLIPSNQFLAIRYLLPTQMHICTMYNIQLQRIQCTLNTQSSKVRLGLSLMYENP